jgi:fructose-bisphosphate aldolase class I
VPIVEPEVLMEGDHSIDASAQASGRALQALYTELHDQRVDLRGTLLKPNMVVSGYESASRAGVDEVAERTLEVLYRHVPAAVPGVVFLSGGQSDEDATAHLDAIVRRGPHPWEVTFSFSRALQASALAAWEGKPENVEAAQRAYAHRAAMNAAARSGSYSPALEQS